MARASADKVTASADPFRGFARLGAPEFIYSAGDLSYYMYSMAMTWSNYSGESSLEDPHTRMNKSRDGYALRAHWSTAGIWIANYGVKNASLVETSMSEKKVHW